MKALLVIIFGDEVAGETADEVALNLAAGTQVALFWGCKPRRPCPDLLTLFRGCKLSGEAKAACRWVQSVYDRANQKPQLKEAA